MALKLDTALQWKHEDQNSNSKTADLQSCIGFSSPYRANLYHQHLFTMQKPFLWLTLVTLWTSKSFWVDTTYISREICGATRNSAARTKIKLSLAKSTDAHHKDLQARTNDTTVLFGGTETLIKNWGVSCKTQFLNTSAVIINAASNISLYCGSQWNMKMYYPNHHLGKLQGILMHLVNWNNFHWHFWLAKRSLQAKKSILTNTSVITSMWPFSLKTHYICSRHLFSEFASRKKAWSS